MPGNNEMDKLKNLTNEIERLNPSDLLTTLDRNRPYDGQSWTSEGIRGKTEIKGITFRDLKDCFIRACYDCSILEPKDYPRTIFELDWEQIDPLALEQNLSCWIERYMGIFPNIPKTKSDDIWKEIPLIDWGDED